MCRKALIGVCLMVLVAASSRGALVSGLGPVSSAGTAPGIIAAPVSVFDSLVFNTGQEAFNEQQGVVLPAAINTDQGSIPAGTVVDSHMIFLNQEDGPPGSVSGSLTHFDVTWTFDGIILGTMSDNAGILEDTTTSILGALGTNYPLAPFAARGLETNDVLTFVGNTLTLGVGMEVTQPGDWIRVVTTTVPEPGSLAVWTLLGIWAIIGTRREIRVKHV